MDYLPDTWQEGVEKLAALAVAVRANLLTTAEKRALEIPNVMSAIGDNKALSHALIGAGAGAGLSGLRTAFSNRSRDPESKRSILGSMLTGGIAGAGLGGGVGLVRDTYGKSLPSLSGGAAAPPTPAGQYTDPVSGKKMQLDLAAIKANPGLASELRQLRTPSLPTAIAGGVAGVWDHLKENAPNATSALPWIAGADLAAHGPWRQHTPGTIGGHFGRQFFNKAVSDGHFDAEGDAGAVGKALRGNLANGTAKDGITATATGAPTAGPRTFLKKLLGAPGDAARYLRTGLTRNSGVSDILGTGTSGPGSGDVLDVEAPKTEKQKVTTGAGNDKIEQEVKRTVGRETHKLNRGQVAAAKMQGAGEDPFGGHSMYRVPGTQRYYRGLGTLKRVGGYGGLLGADYLAHSLRGDSDNQKKIHDLIAQYAKEVK